MGPLKNKKNLLAIEQKNDIAFYITIYLQQLAAIVLSIITLHFSYQQEYGLAVLKLGSASIPAHY